MLIRSSFKINSKTINSEVYILLFNLNNYELLTENFPDPSVIVIKGSLGSYKLYLKL